MPVVSNNKIIDKRRNSGRTALNKIIVTGIFFFS